MKTFFQILILILSSAQLKSQGFLFELNYSKGANFGTISNNEALGLNNCCDDFNKFSGSSDAILSKFGYAFNPYYELDFALNYNSNQLIFNKIKSELIGLDNLMILGKFKNHLEINNQAAAFAIGSAFNFKQWKLHTSFSLTVPITADFSQYEKIISPADKGVFIDTRTRTRNKQSGEFSRINPSLYSVDFSIEYLLKLNKQESLFLSPKLSYSHFLNDYFKDAGMTKSSFAAGLSIVFYPMGKQKPFGDLLAEQTHYSQAKFSITLFQIEKGKEMLINPIIINNIEINELLLPKALPYFVNSIWYNVSRKINADSLRFYFYGADLNASKSLSLYLGTENNNIFSPMSDKTKFDIDADSINKIIGSDNKINYFISQFDKNGNSQNQVSDNNELMFENQYSIKKIYWLIAAGNSSEIVNAIQSIIIQNNGSEHIKIEFPKSLPKALKEEIINANATLLNSKRKIIYSDAEKSNPKENFGLKIIKIII